MEVPELIFLMRTLRLRVESNNISATEITYAKMPIKKVKLTHKYTVTTISKLKTSRHSIPLHRVQEIAARVPDIEIPVSDSKNTFTDPEINAGEESKNIHSVGKSTYDFKKEKTIDGWNKIRGSLITTHIEELAPSTNQCCMCGSVEEDIIYFQDCGPMAYYCESCCFRLHEFIVFHSPQIWKGHFYLPFEMITTFRRIDNHECSSIYIYLASMPLMEKCWVIVICIINNLNIILHYNREIDPALTLVRYRLWPASPQKPRIAFDIRLMELLSSLQLECHLSAKSFCAAVESMQTDFIRVSHDFSEDKSNQFQTAT
ncbi:hypothetical protein KUTeg_022224 [Tegillarca granosa]|uniref:CxC3 like cysteine cluster domain-containing protein n=1 Tax=Tegillarca granosa TaxID=220873 RepID=A0ABQ9EB63_TEGGR|nr:hypothetical protein KUTeg_022224 [Tegillarca granosa]